MAKAANLCFQSHPGSLRATTSPPGRGRTSILRLRKPLPSSIRPLGGDLALCKVGAPVCCGGDSNPHALYERQVLGLERLPGFATAAKR